MVSLKVVTVTVSVLVLLVGDVGVVTDLTVFLPSLRKEKELYAIEKLNRISNAAYTNSPLTALFYP